jgi:hypothetical protein
VGAPDERGQLSHISILKKRNTAAFNLLCTFFSKIEDRENCKKITRTADACIVRYGKPRTLDLNAAGNIDDTCLDLPKNHERLRTPPQERSTKIQLNVSFFHE